VYDYLGTPIGAPGDQSACRTILVLGDSLAKEVVTVLSASYDQHDYCVTVVNGAVDGANTMATPQGQTMSNLLADFAKGYTPDAVVFSFVGNVMPAQVATARSAYLTLIDQAASYGRPVFVTTPPVSAGFCNPDDPWTRGHAAFREFVLKSLPALRTYTPVRWSEVLTPGSTWARFNDSLRFNDGVRPVRSFDCVHLGKRTGTTTRGETVAAAEIVAATQGLWALPEPPELPEVPEPDPTAEASELPPPEPVG
jgi:hypothetical protein